jgi:hypothetical protein
VGAPLASIYAGSPLDEGLLASIRQCCPPVLGGGPISSYQDQLEDQVEMGCPSAAPRPSLCSVTWECTPMATIPCAMREFCVVRVVLLDVGLQSLSPTQGAIVV